MTTFSAQESAKVENTRMALRHAMVVRVTDLSIHNRGRPLPLRIYIPPGDGPHAVLMFFHGGGWVTGDLDTHDGFCRLMCEWAGCAVVAVDYARPPEQVFPVAIEDCCCATQWVVEHGVAIDLDASQLAVAGGGSGGGLAAVICHWARDEGNIPIAFQLLLYPLLDCITDKPSHRAFAEGCGLSAQMLEWYIVHYVPQHVPRDDWRVSPVRQKNLKGLPPALIITSGQDVLRDEGREYVQRLKQAGVEVQHVEYEHMQHGFINYPAQHDEARQALMLCARSLQEHLRID
ncbi:MULTISPECIES: alpha/beta hydrolase [unclassified Pseudomonas]|uniref:alpha/beta hydrolase n=1 Tax=unclassified Pseudomonas TaxID=196821 RepID=UPI000A1E55B2|nr:MULTISPECIES: alpha/beta hydrolase [unclassified Pseudomonas]